MSNTFAVWLVGLAGLVLANLPFASQRLFGVITMRLPKQLPLRLLELVVLYFVVLGIGLLLEKRAGQIAPQGWEFYAVTAAVFLTLAFPGFVYRYLLRSRKRDA